MKNREQTCKKQNCNGKELLENFYKDSSQLDFSKACDDCIQEFMETEENLVELFQMSIDSYLLNSEKDAEIQQFQANLDIQKADSELSKIKDLEVPVYLKTFMSKELNRTQIVEDSIIVKIGKTGVNLLKAFMNGEYLTPKISLAPAMRSSAAIKERVPSIVLEEVLPDQQFTYQIIKENDEEAYLNIKFNDGLSYLYDYVNLKKNNRFIYSSIINKDGIITFSGLKEGDYKIEFIGKNKTKSFDLSIIIE